MLLIWLIARPVYQVERKPTLKPPVDEILIFTDRTQMFQINGDLDVCVRCTAGTTWSTWFETWCSTWSAFNTAAAEFDAVLKSRVDGNDMRRQSNAVKPIVTTLVMVTLPHCLPCSIMMLKRAMAHSCLQLSTRRTVKQINSHFGTLLY